MAIANPHVVTAQDEKELEERLKGKVKELKGAFKP